LNHGMCGFFLECGEGGSGPGRNGPGQGSGGVGGLAAEAGAFAFGQAAPDAVTNVVGEGPGQALHADRADSADFLRLLHRAALLGEEEFGVDLPAYGLFGDVHGYGEGDHAAASRISRRTSRT